MVTDEEIDKFIEEGEQDKEEYIKENLDPDVERQLNEMGYLWRAVHEKLEKDNVCFECGKKIIDKDAEDHEPMRLIIPGKVDKGVVAFCSVCKDCYERLEKEQQEKDKEKEVDGDTNAE